MLRRVAAYMREHTEELAPLMTEEMGKPIGEAHGEVAKSAWAAEHYAEHAAKYLADEHLASGRDLLVRAVPAARPGAGDPALERPVLGRLPLLRSGADGRQHLRDEARPPRAGMCGRAGGGVPGGRCTGGHLPVTPGRRPRTSSRRSAIPRIRAVSFTGSDRAGATVASIAAGEIKPAVLELGGSDPCIVLADADLQKAAEVSALSRIINAGQSCIAAKRVIVERSVHDEFVELLAAQLRDLVVGDPRDRGHEGGADRP